MNKKRRLALNDAITRMVMSGRLNLERLESKYGKDYPFYIDSRAIILAIRLEECIALRQLLDICNRSVEWACGLTKSQINMEHVDSLEVITDHLEALCEQTPGIRGKVIVDAARRNIATHRAADEKSKWLAKEFSEVNRNHTYMVIDKPGDSTPLRVKTNDPDEAMTLVREACDVVRLGMDAHL